MYGAQTGTQRQVLNGMFENDVEMYGAQTNQDYALLNSSLRMM